MMSLFPVAELEKCSKHTLSLLLVQLDNLASEIVVRTETQLHGE